MGDHQIVFTHILDVMQVIPPKRHTPPVKLSKIELYNLKVLKSNPRLT